MPHRIHRPAALIITIAVAQAVCLGAGVFGFAAWMRSSVRAVVYQQVLDDNAQTALQIASMVQHMGVDDVRESNATWRRLQNSIGGIELPNEGFVCLTDARNGALLCHPDFNGVDAPMAKKYMAGSRYDTGVSTANALTATIPGNPADPNRPPIQASVRDYGGELQIIAAGRLRGVDLNVNVHQKTSGVEARLDGLMKPVVPVGLTVAALLVALTTGAIVLIVRRYDAELAVINAGLEDTVHQRTAALRKTGDAVVFGLAKLAESRDTDTGQHLERIAAYTTTLAHQLGTAPREVENLALASSLHDIGKVGIRDAILLKPGRFEPDERTVMETHAALGGACLDAIGEQLGEDDFLQLAREIAYGHHEKWDGTGYPAQVRGDDIPVSARIVALADVYDALRSRRPYKDPMPHPKARQIIIEGRGTHFDPAIVDAFLACEDAFRTFSDSSNGTGDQAPPAAAA